jgi:hypothetical protein
MKNLDEMFEQARIDARDAGRDHALRYPDTRLRDIGFGLRAENDLYAIAFREGFFEAGGQD